MSSSSRITRDGRSTCPAGSVAEAASVAVEDSRIYPIRPFVDVAPGRDEQGGAIIRGLLFGSSQAGPAAPACPAAGSERGALDSALYPYDGVLCGAVDPGRSGALSGGLSPISWPRA